MPNITPKHSQHLSKSTEPLCRFIQEKWAPAAGENDPDAEYFTFHNLLYLVRAEFSTATSTNALHRALLKCGFEKTAFIIDGDVTEVYHLQPRVTLLKEGEARG